MIETGCHCEIPPVADGREVPSPGTPVVIPEAWSADLVFVTDLQGRLTFVNDAWQRHLGYAAQAVLGQEGVAWVEPAFRDTYQAALQQAVGGQGVENIEFRAVTQGGGLLDLLANLAPLRDAQGQIVQVLASARDITTLQRLPERLTRAHERLRILFEQAPTAYYLNDLMSTFLDGNRAAEELFGYPREELIGKSLLKSDLLPRKQLPRAAGYFAQNAMGRPVGPVELRLNRKDGTPVQIEARSYPVQIDGQHVVLGIARDITQRKRAEQSLRESEEKFKIIFEEAHEGIVYLDDAGRVLEVNRQMLAILGQSKEQVVGRHFIELGILDAGDVGRFLNLFQQVLLGTLAPLEVCLTNQQGRQLYVECSASLVHKKGATHGLVVLIRDVTERHQAQALRESLHRDLQATVARLEHSNQELQDFAHVAAHDLKTPLRGIVTLADWILQDCADKVSSQGQEYLHLLQQRATRMMRLIDGIVRYVEVGREDVPVENVQGSTVVAEVLAQMALPPQVVVEVDDPLPTVRCARTHLAQVFHNLLSNAVKYRDKPDSRIRVGSVADGAFWRFHVTDNGPGIEARHRERIFGIFQTLAPKDDGASTGIGLALVRKIVERYRGRIWVESAVGTGSTFYFTWPKMREGE